MNTDEQIVAKGYATRALDYSEAASALMQLEKRGELNLRSGDPIDLLASHSFELALKSELVQQDLGAAKDFGHKLLNLYDKLAEETEFVPLLELLVEEKWKAELHRLRDQRQRQYPETFGMIDELNGEMPSNIDALRFSLRDAIVWFNGLMNTNGNLFRYHQDRHYVGTQFSFAGETFDKPRQSLIWASQLLANKVIQGK